MLGSIRGDLGEGGIIEGKKTGRRWQMSVESWTKRSEEKMKGVSKKKETRVAKIINKGCRFTGEALAALPLLS